MDTHRPQHLYLIKFLPLLLIAALLLAGCQAQTPPPPTATVIPSQTPTPVPTPTTTPEPSLTPSPWNLVWSDEFDGKEIDRSKWTFDLGATGWGNSEMELYTDRPENVRLEDGMLVIEARKEAEPVMGHEYTSARLKTQALASWTYGRIEARLKIPYGQGIWPAFWMLGDDILRSGWPACGEIDIMENIGKEPNIIHGTVHGQGYSGGGGLGGLYTLSQGRFADDFHVYAIEWQPESIRWYVDDTLFLTVTSQDTGGKKWVFDHPFFIILNLAIGGGWPGYPNETTVFPQYLHVDYVRVYQLK